ncbi:unnamed protein product [Cuscuta campestris]|uniref:CCHC-type domain-containing protein n=1 Tax=Cuscuta campestris TaxID=132261 RepID=A0A484LTQ8_9ASTE|nr:unnamed protein product [Cuscuta campestris]
MAIQISKFEKLEELLRPHQHSLAPRRWKPRHKSSKPQLHLLLQNSIKDHLPHSPTHPAPLEAVNPVFVEDSLFGSVCQAAENEGDSICVNLPLRTGLSNNVSQGDKDIVLAQTQFGKGTVTEAIDKPESVESRGNSDISSCSLVNEGAYIDSLKGREAVAGRHDQVHKLLSPFAKEFIPQSNSFSTLSHLGTEENVLDPCLDEPVLTEINLLLIDEIEDESARGDLQKEYELLLPLFEQHISDDFEQALWVIKEAIRSPFVKEKIQKGLVKTLEGKALKATRDAMKSAQSIRVIKLRGYDDWKIMMEAHLYALHDCMWMVLEDGPLKIQMENPERNPTNPDVVQYIPKPNEKWDDRDCKKHNLDNVTKAAIFKTLDPITFSKIKHLKTAMEIWQGLGKLCDGSEDLRKQKIEVLLEKFKSFKMLPRESFDMLDERFHKILNDLASLNHVLSPKEKNVRLLRSLPTEWYTKATAMEERRNLENYAVQGLLNKLRTYEHELKKKKKEQVTPFPTALMTTPRVPSGEGTCPRNCDTPSFSQPSSSKTENYDEEFAMMVKQFRKFNKFFKKAESVRRPSKRKPQVSESPPEFYLCYNCRKPDHLKSACPYSKLEKCGERERNEKKKVMVAAESDESSSSSSDEEALVCMKRRVEKSNHEDR